MLYIWIKILHLFCACAVIGYLFYDIAVFSYFKKKRSEDEFLALKRELLKPSILVLGLSFTLLILSGVFLSSYYLGGTLGFFHSNFQKILMLKILLVALLFIFAFISIFCMFVLKKGDIFRKYYHHLAFGICILALILAKLLFIF